MPPSDSEPKDPREKRRPKDSEFYQIPPDLKQEFDLIMAGRSAPSQPMEDIARDRRARKLGTASLILSLLGAFLIGVGPILAIVLGLTALRSGGDSDEENRNARTAKLGILFGALMLPVNALTLFLLLNR